MLDEASEVNRQAMNDRLPRKARHLTHPWETIIKDRDGAMGRYEGESKDARLVVFQIVRLGRKLGKERL